MRNRHAAIGSRLRIGLAAVVAGWLAQPCWAGKVWAQVAPGADFARYKTYQWLPTRVLRNTGEVENDPVLSPLIKAAVNQELASRGLKEVAEGGDLQISAAILTTAIPQRPGAMLEGGSGAADIIYYTPVATMGGYNRQGTLVVNLIDAQTKKSAWSGMATESVGKEPGSGQKKIPVAVGKIFKKYPSGK